MKSNKILSIALLLFIAVFSIIYFNSYAYSNPEIFLSNVSDSTQTPVYTCPMHPDIVMDKPGQCPKCGMDLVLKTDDSQNSKSMNCDNMDKCKDKDCSKETCMGNSGGCGENCPKMKDMDMNEHHAHDKMDHKKCKSEGNSGCMGH